MSFLSFNEKYFLQKLSQYESHPLSVSELLEAKQNLKILDDLVDEGYLELSEYLESKHQCVTRLRELLIRHGETPFPMPERSLPECSYSTESEEVTAAVNNLMQEAVLCEVDSENLFLGDILNYCRWIEYREDTAYVFLLRDTLLPYIYFKTKGRQNLYPWLINRRFLRELSGISDLDDQIRLPIYDALESGTDSYEAFFRYCRPRIMAVMDSCPALKAALEHLLTSIPQEHIMVIESGYCATFPMLLAVLDDRVDFRLYTTAPYLYNIYDGKTYRCAYEQIRSFETLYSQDLYFQYGGFTDGKFLVQKTRSQEVQCQSFQEVKYIMGECKVKIAHYQKESFAVIGKEGSTNEGNGFIQRLWADANSHFAEVAHLAKKDDNGDLVGIWGAMSDHSRSFMPWEDGFSKGLYLAGVECVDDAQPPEGWTKWVIPGFEYLCAECDHDTVFSDMIAYLNENQIPLSGAVHDFTCPQTGKNYMFFPVRKL